MPGPGSGQPTEYLHCVLGDSELLDHATDPDRRIVVADGRSVAALAAFAPLYGRSLEFAIGLRDPLRWDVAHRTIGLLAARAAGDHAVSLQAEVRPGQHELAATVPHARLRQDRLTVRVGIDIRVAPAGGDGYETSAWTPARTLLG